MAIVTTDRLARSLVDMLLLYGDRNILTITDGENEYQISGIDGYPCAKRFEPSDNIAEIVIKIKKK